MADYRITSPVAGARWGMAIALTALLVIPAHAAVTVKWSDWLESVKISGDMRLREELIQKESPGQVDRNRQRARFRLGVEMIMPQNLSLKFQFATGAGDQVSTNQSFDNLSEQKQVRFDLFYVKWTPKKSSDETISIVAGRMDNHFWRPYTSDLVWDDDFRPEGFGQSVEWTSDRSVMFVNLMQMVVDEDESATADQWMVGAQIGAGYRTKADSNFRVALAFYNWINEDSPTGAPTTSSHNFGQVTVQEGNRRSGTNLLNEFGVAELSTEFTRNFGVRPVTFDATLIRNIRAKRTFSPRANNGWQTGARYGKADHDRTWELAYYYKRVEADATVADIADSDFGDGGTNRKGHIVWAAYNPWKWMQFKARYIATRVLNENLPPNVDTVSRLQFDASVKF